MRNVTTQVSEDGRKLTIEIDLTKEYGLSGSGKSVIIASTDGGASLGETGTTLNLTLYRKAGRGREVGR